MNESGPSKIGDLLSVILARRGYADRTAVEEIESAWEETASEQIRGRTRLGALRRGVLEVLVDNAVLLQQLQGFEKENLLAGLQKRVKHSRILDLRFRRL